MSTEEWLKNLNMKRGSCCKASDAGATGRQVLTQKNLIAHDQSLTALHRLVSAEDDGGSSVYSVDQDGYYTSMHRDCGVGRGGPRSDLIPDFTAGGSHCIVKSRKNPFFVANTPKGKAGSQGKAKKTPPPPPPRVSTMLDRSIVSESTIDGAMMNVEDLRKTASMCPSTCPMSPVDSAVDDDYAGEWRQQVSHARTGLKSTMSAPGGLSNYAARSTIIASASGAKMDCIAEVSNESSADQSCSSVDDSMLPRYQCRRDDDASEGYSTWPRSPRNVLGKRQTESILKNGGASSKQRLPQTLIFAPTVNIFDENDKGATTHCGIPQVHSPNEFLAKQRMLAKNAPLHYRPPFQNQADVSQQPYSSSISTWPRLRLTNTGDTSVPASSQIQEPVAAPARLIISSPVAGQAAFVENPHKRVLCSPVTTEDLIAFSTCTSPKCQRVPAMRPSVPQTTPSFSYHAAPPDCIIQSPTVNEIPSNLPFTECSAFKPVSQPLFPSLSAMKHSIPFPVPNAQNMVKPTSATRSWYDGMHTKVYDSPLGEHNDVLRTSLLKESSEGPVVVRPRRDSNASTMSTHSSSSSRRSVTFATVHRSSSASLVTKLDRAVSSSLLSVPEQSAGVGVKRSRSTCSSSSEASWRHKYAPSSLCPGVAPPTLPTFTTFARRENDAKRPRVGMETNDTHERSVISDHEAVINEAYHFQVAPANMCFTGFTSLQQVSQVKNTQPCKKIKPKVPQRNCSMKDAKVEPERLPFGSSVFGAAQTNDGQSRVNGATSETFTLPDSTFVRSYAPPKFVVPKRDACSADRATGSGTSGVLFNVCQDMAGPVQKRNVVNNEYIHINYNDTTNGNVLVNGTSRVSQKDNVTHDISSKKTEAIYSSKLAFLSKNIADRRSVDRRFSEHQLGLSASCSSLAKDKSMLRSDGSHVLSLQGLCEGKTDAGMAKGDDQSSSSCPLVSPAVSSLSSSGLGSSVASSPDSRPNSPDLTDAPGELKSQTADAYCKT